VFTRVTLALYLNVTFGIPITGRTQLMSASLLAWTRQGKPSQVLQRMHGLFSGSAGSRFNPSGTG
jgi:hypothetical protein